MENNLSVNPWMLTINGGSSSIKFAVFEMRKTLQEVFRGSIDRIGGPVSTLQVKGEGLNDELPQEVLALDYLAAVNILIKWLETRHVSRNLNAIAYRIVHGGTKYSKPQKVTKEFMEDFESLMHFASEHTVKEKILLEGFLKKFPELPHFVCFDTAFHADIPQVAKLLPIPRRYESMGLRRYGFHGLSYEFVMDELSRLEGSDLANGRVVLAHLGSGSSLSAVFKGRSIDTSMGFTPCSGVPMATRSGDIDPGLFGYLAHTEGMSSKEFEEMLSYKSGLLGLSERSGDMRDLLCSEASDEKAAEAISLFCYQVKKYIGAFSASLGGLDALVFTGGIGENLPVIRDRICGGLDFLGVILDKDRNALNEGLISSQTSRVIVRVIPTNEEKVLAKTTYCMFNSTKTKE